MELTTLDWFVIANGMLAVIVLIDDISKRLAAKVVRSK